MFKKLKISTRLSIGFGAVCVLTVLVSFIALMRMSQTAQVVAHEKLIRTTQLDHLYELREALDQTGIAARNAYIYETDKDALTELDVLDQQRMIYLDRLNKLKPVLAGQRGFDKLSEELMTMAKELDRPRKYRMASEMKAYGTFLVNECSPLRRRVVADLDVLIKSIQTQLDEAAVQVDGTLADSKVLLSAIALGALLLGAVVAYRVTVGIVRPLAEAADFAQAVAIGDLTRKIAATSKDEIGVLMASLDEMRRGLAKIVGDVRSGTDLISTSSSELSLGNLNLSARTEQQAGSIEQTAASIEELSITVRNNSDNARQGSALADAASETASRGGKVVEQVVVNMGDIHTSATKIVDIIAVIDSIAFQTNILALNAAVEAARAGEQGRGFAVVASEVRTLAQRSATAAKEIKGLIDNSVSKVNAGSKLVSEAGSTIGELVESVRRVNGIMAEIATASREQSEGIQLVNEAIRQMDQVTQQNATLVEEAATATGSMQQQAQALADAVSVFRIDGQQAGLAQQRSPAASQGRPVTARLSQPKLASVSRGSAPAISSAA